MYVFSGPVIVVDLAKIMKSATATIRLTVTGGVGGGGGGGGGGGVVEESGGREEGGGSEGTSGSESATDASTAPTESTKVSCRMFDMDPFDASIAQYFEKPPALEDCPRAKRQKIEKNQTSFWLEKRFSRRVGRPSFSYQ